MRSGTLLAKHPIQIFTLVRGKFSWLFSASPRLRGELALVSVYAPDHLAFSCADFDREISVANVDEAELDTAFFIERNRRRGIDRN
jgi:hypothetical protein